MSGDFFIGWASQHPRPHRRAFLAGGLALTVGAGGLAAALARAQKPAGSGTWVQSDIRDWRGTVTGHPYSMLRTRDLDGTPRTVLLSCLGKCGVSARIGALEGHSVIVRGSPIRRGQHAMIAVADGMDWIRPDDSAVFAPPLPFPEPEPLGTVRLAGEILDTKCWFGAMRPSRGKPHKACAALCIRHGIPPALFARDGAGRETLLILTDGGARHDAALLPFVGEPVEITGAARRAGNLLYLDASVNMIRRL